MTSTIEIIYRNSNTNNGIKDNWELASYAMEDHSFVEPSSWTDEYKRIYKLFETVLKK